MSTSPSSMQAVILCGGQGTRIRGVADDRPKPLIDIGGKPILWHIMKIYAHYGVRRFILALGYQGDKIVDYFRTYRTHTQDFTLCLRSNEDPTFHAPRGSSPEYDDWEITFAHTGMNTMTGGRVARIAQYVDQPNFFCTYGDGVSDVNIQALYDHHLETQNIGTLLAVHLPTTFGIVEAGPEGTIQSFREKPVLSGHVNGGFFCFNRALFEFLGDDSTVLEGEPLRQLVQRSKLGMVEHEGFWHAMDTFKDYTTLNDMWHRNAAPWKIW